MRKLILGSLFLAGTALAAAPPAKLPVRSNAPVANAVSLTDCYARALKVSETLQISEQDIAQLESQYRQGVGNVLPHLSWQMTQLWQDTSGVDSSTSGVQGTLLRQRRPESYFMVTQPLFHGLRDFNAIRGFKAAAKGARYNADQAALNLLVDVAEVFYVSLDLQEELAVLSSQRMLTGDRLEELERRVRLGRSRDSEVLSSQVELASLDALIEDTRQRWSVARYTLRFLAEVPLEVPLKNERSAPVPPILENALSKAATGRPDLMAADQNRRAEQYRVSYAKGNYYPGLDFMGKYYTERVGFNEDVKWDALLSLDVPIFKGGQTRAEVQNAKSRLIVAELEHARLNRQVQREVETAHGNLNYTLSQVKFYEKAVNLAQKNYKLQTQEYRLGLINNLQVLDVLNDLQDLQLRKLRSEASMRLNDIRLRVAMGQGL